MGKTKDTQITGLGGADAPAIEIEILFPERYSIEDKEAIWKVVRAEQVARGLIED